MRKFLLLFLIMLLPILVYADAVEINGIYYNLITKAKLAEVTLNPNRYSGSIEIPSTVDYEGISYSVIKIDDLAFSYCENVTSISIPNSITDIGGGAFRECNIESITIPNSVKKINSGVFYGCRKLTSITFGNGLEKIAYDVFEDCVSLNKVVVKDIAAWCGVEMYYNSNPLQYAKHLYSDENTEITELVIPDGVTYISDYAFSGCSNITSLSLPNSVEYIGYEAFSDLNITNVTIPNKVTYLTGFSRCANLESVTIPQNVTTIGRSAFRECTGITSIEIPNSVTSIEKMAFFETNLTSVIIPNSVITIGDCAFAYCQKLQKVIMGDAVQSIEDCAFGYCQELTDVFCYAEFVPHTLFTAFESSLIEYATLHVPEKAIDSYKSSVPWNGFGKFEYVEPVAQEDNAEYVEAEDNAEYVDLGLPSGVLWATKNVGANNPEEVGDYFAWGETSPKDEYKWSTYKHVISKETYLTKYCNSYGGYGNVDNKETLDPEDDAATVNLGNSWRTPTLSEMQELREYCKWQHVTLNGVNGYTVISPNGRAIFIPSGGMMQSEKLVSREDVFLMSSTYDYDDNLNACIFSIIHDIPEFDYLWRAWGYNVRPVVNTTPTKIVGLSAGNTPQIIGIYNLHGQKLNGYQKGINIVKYSDGTSKKIVK